MDDVKFWVDNKKSKICIETLVNMLNKINKKNYLRKKMLKRVVNDN
jgi:hypothetical protein